MRILKVMPFFDPATQFGGVVSQARIVCRELARRGHEISVITTDNGVPGEIPRDQWILRDGYRVYYSRTRALHRCPPYWTPRIRRALAATLPRTDVLVTNVGLTLMSRLAARMAQKHCVPHVYNAEGALCPVRLRIKRLQKLAFVRLVEGPLVRRAAAVQAMTAKDRADTLRLGVAPERIHVIPNGIELAEQVRGGPPIRRELGLPEDALLVLFAGRLQAIKGIDLLVRTLAAADVPEAHLLLVGPDEDGSGAGAIQLAEEIGLAGRVHAIGRLDGEALSQAFDASDVFALTSHSEGLPNAILEALAHGLPCLLSAHCNVAEVQEHGAGFVLPLDIDSLADALREQLKDSSLRERQSRAAHDLAATRFALSEVCSQLEALYARIAEDARR